jgi:hypothetical protein
MNEITERLKMHLNFGKKGARRICIILVDGKDTGITRLVDSSGPPKYLKKADLFIKGIEQFDFLNYKGKDRIGDAKAWILARVEHAGSV